MADRDWTIRVPRPADAAGFAAMWHEFHRDPPPGFGPAWSLDDAQAFAEAACRHPPGSFRTDRLLVACCDGSPAGWITVQHDSELLPGRGWYVNGLGVAPSWRRHGAARRLIAYAVALAAREPVALYTAVDRGNTAALAAFRSCGFTDSPIRGGFDDSVAVLVRPSQ